MIKVGIIGTSKITYEFLNGIKEVDGIEVSVIYSRSLEKGKEIAKDYNIPFVETDIEVFNKRDDIDMVYIASPNSLHFQQTIKLLENKKHVLCEKPMGITEAEVEEMFETAFENKVCLMEAMKTTLTPNFLSLKENLYKIGKIRGAILNYSQYSSRYTDLKNGQLTNIFNPKFGGGAHLDIGVYPMYFALALFGIPQNEIGANFILDSGVPGIGNVILEYKDMIASIFYSKISNSYIPSEIQGEKGSIIIENLSTVEKIRIVYHNGEVENITLEQEKNVFIYEIQEFLKMIKNKELESKINSKEISKNVIRILTK